MGKDNYDTAIPELGMAAAAFACLLVVASVERPSAQLLEAVRIFAVSIPITVAGTFVMIVRRGKKKPWIRTILWILRLASVAVGNVGCGIGVYWVFRHISASAARNFLGTSLLCWILIGALSIFLDRADETGSERSGKPNAGGLAHPSEP